MAGSRGSVSGADDVWLSYLAAKDQLMDMTRSISDDCEPSFSLPSERGTSRREGLDPNEHGFLPIVFGLSVGDRWTAASSVVPSEELSMEESTQKESAVCVRAG